MLQNPEVGKASTFGVAKISVTCRYLRMRAIVISTVTHLAILTVALVGGAGIAFAEVPKAELEGKIAFCNICHGPKGQGYKGFYTGPRLAGQTVQYTESQFRQMLINKRDNPAARHFMVPALRGLSKEMLTALAQYYSDLDPAPAADGPAKLVAAGKVIFDKGVPDAGVPACTTCHGPEAKGINAIPRLAGQLYEYTVSQLKGWQHGLRSMDSTNSDKPSTMVPIAKDMTAKQISAVAAYVSTLK
jgi:cytochrome c553